MLYSTVCVYRKLLTFFPFAADPSGHSSCLIHSDNGGSAWDTTLHRPAHTSMQHTAGPRVLSGFQWAAPSSLQCASPSKWVSVVTPASVLDVGASVSVWL